MAGDLVTIRSFNLPWEADLCRVRLEQEGIKACVNEDRSALINYFWTTALGGIKVQVVQSDAERAEAVLGKSGMQTHESRRLVKLFGLTFLVLYALAAIISMLGGQ